MKIFTKLFACSFLLFISSLFTTAYSQAVLSVTDLTFATSLNKGSVQEMVYSLKNVGSAGSHIDSLKFQCHVTPSNVAYFPGGSHKYYLTYTHDSVLNNYYTKYTYPFYNTCVSNSRTNSYSLDTIATHYNIISRAMIHALTGKDSLGVNEAITIHVPVTITSCSNTTGSMYFYVDSLGYNADFKQEPINFSVNAGNPQFYGSPDSNMSTIVDSAYFCSNTKDSATVGFKIKNTDPTSNVNIRPYADSLRVYLYCSNVATLDVNSFRINNVKISASYVYHYTSGSFNVYLLRMFNFPAGVCGDTLGNNTLMDLSGDGKADDLAQGQSFIVTATIKYQTSCPAFANCGTTAWTLPGLELNWQNQCGTRMFFGDTIAPFSTATAAELIRQFYEAVTNTSTMTVPPDITLFNSQFNANMCVDNYDQYWSPYNFFDCHHPDYQLIMPMPTGYHLNISAPALRYFSGIPNAMHTGVFKFRTSIVTHSYPGCPPASYTDTLATVQEFFSPTDYIVVNLDTLPRSLCNGQTAFVPQCFNVPLELNCHDFDSLHVNVNKEPDAFTYKLQYICNESSPCDTCGDVLQCGSTSTWHHCFGPCNFAPYTTQGWIMDRTNFGYVNQPSANFYDNCGGAGMVPIPSDIISDTIPVDSSSAYPGDKMKILVNGGFDSIPANFNDILLRVQYSTISGSVAPFYLFERSQTDTSYFIIDTCIGVPALSHAHLPLYPCPLSNRSCGDYYNGVNAAGMIFSLGEAINNYSPALYSLFLADPVDERLRISAHIFMRVKNDGPKNVFDAYPDFLHGGRYDVKLRTEYMAMRKDTITDTMPSCDPWGGQVTLLESNPQVGLSDYNVANNSPPHTSTCDTFDINFAFTAPTAIAAQDDYPYEFRPIGELDSVLTVTLPKGYSYATTQFYTFTDNYNLSGSDNHFAGNASIKYYPIVPFSITGNAGVGTVLTYHGLGYGTDCWPLFDQKYTNSSSFPGSYITIKTLPTCAANDTDTVKCVTGYVLGTQQPDTAYRVHIIDTMIKLRIFHENPVVNVVLPVAVTDYSNTITFRFRLCDSNFDSPIPWLAFENMNHYLLNMGTATLFDSTANIIYNNGHQYFKAPDNAGVVYNLKTLGANTCDWMIFTAQVEDSSAACPPVGILAKMRVRFGNVCIGNDTLINPDSAHCESRVDTFGYHVYKAALSLFQDSYSPNPVCLKGDTLVDSLIIESTNLGTVINPTLWIYPPAGITFGRMVITYPCDTVNFTPHGHPSSNGDFAPDTAIYNSTTGAVIAYGWIMDRLLHINGLPGTLATPSGSDANFMCVKVYLAMSCSYNKNNPIEYFATGTSTCNTLISSDTLFVKFHVDSTCCLPPVDSCALAAGPYDTIIRGPVSARQIHNGPINFNCKKILIQGKFIVNENVTFSACDIAFAPYALIDIDSNHTLSINSGGVCSHLCPHLYAPCDTMWRGIFVEPGSEVEIADNALIEDADTAIYAENGGSTASLYSLLNSIVFNHCYKDIVVGPYTGAYQGKAQGCLFTNRDFSSIPNCDWRADYRSAPVTMISKVPNASTFTKIGWQVNNVKHFEDNGGNDVYTGGNTFDNLQLGIDDYQSNMTICTDTFQNMTHGNPAIYSNNPGTVADSLNVGGPPIYHEPNRFYNCYKGVYCNGRHSEISIRYNGFINPPSANAITAIYVTGMGVHGAPLIIEADTIKNYVKGIICNLNLHLTADINYNTITDNVCSINNWIGIGISETRNTDALYTIDSNKINILNYGIFENDVFNSNINANKINLGTIIGCPSTRYQGSGIEVASCDSVNIACNIVKAPPVSQIAVNHYIGIFEKQSKFVHIWNNTTQVEKVHIAFQGTPVMGTNLWNNNLIGNSVDTGIYDPAGVVGNMGSAALGTNNIFNAVPWACGKKVAGTIYHILNASFVPPNSCPIPFLGAGALHAINCPSPPPLINNKTARVLSNSGDTVIIDSITLAAMYKTALNKDTFYVNADTNRLLAKIGVLGTLWQHQYLLTDSIFKRFNDSMSNASIGKIMAIDSNMVSKDSNLNYASILSSLSGISPHNNIEQYLLTSTHGFLDYKINKDSLGSGEIATLTYVANLCAYWNGPGVYLARSVISPYDTDGTMYLDDCPTDNGNRMLKNNGDSSASSKFNLYPNPNSGGFTVDYNLMQGQTGQLIIYTMLGQEEAIYALDANNNRMSIKDNSLSNGIYLYVITVNNTEVKRDKLIIIK